MDKQFTRAAVIMGTGFAAAQSHAAGLDFSALTDSVDLSSAVTAVLAVAAAMALVRVAIAGGRNVLGMIR